MISVSSAVLEALDAPTRQITAKIIIHFSTPLTITGSNYLVDFNSLEEEFLDSHEIFGGSSANEVSIKLLNENRIFSVTNTSSPYYGQLKPGIKVEVFLQVLSTDIPVGVFYTVEWPMGTTGTFVDLVCRDRLYLANKKPVTAIPVQSVTVKNAIENLFINAGVSNYSVDSSLTYQIPNWFHNDGSLGDILREFTTGYGCRIFVDKYDTIKVVKARSGSPVKTLTGANQIIDLKSRSDNRYVFSEVDVEFTSYSVVEDDYFKEADTSVVKTFRPTILVKAVKSEKDVTGVAFDCDKITVISSADTEAVIDVDSLEAVTTHVQRQSAGLVSSFGAIERKLRTRVVQDTVEAYNIADAALSGVRIEKVLEASVRGFPVLELGDRVTINNNATETTGDYYITSMKYEFAGSLKAAYTLLKV